MTKRTIRVIEIGGAVVGIEVRVGVPQGDDGIEVAIVIASVIGRETERETEKGREGGEVAVTVLDREREADLLCWKNLQQV
mmetsp:Transcript_20217/g.51663  ORF Transcript_20217/g.51663 Transcript_20217/m.51663 type:complete len:81 (+) Transcript_20217:501-743(+)